MKISTFLKVKSRPLVTIGPNETISVAIQKLVENDIGALALSVTDGFFTTYSVYHPSA